MIGIVGGGISGLFALHLLRKEGLDVVLFESSGTPGGVLRTHHLATSEGRILPLDLGPQRMRLTRGLAAIVDEAGLTSSLLFVRGREPFTMVWEGKLHPAPASLRAALSTSLISWPGKLRALSDLFTAAPHPDESVEDALTRKLGPEIYERLAGPILGGLYGSHPREMEARHTLIAVLERTGGGRSLLRALRRAATWESIPAVSFRTGMGALAERLTEMHRDAIHLSSPIRAIFPEEGGGFRIETEDSHRTVRQVVLTLPAPEAARVLHSLAPDAADRLSRLRYNPLAVVHLSLPEGSPLPQMGSGFKTTLRDPRLTRGVTSHHGLFGEDSGRSHLYTAFLGGMGREEVLTLSDEELLAAAVTDFQEVTGVEPTALAVHRTMMPAWDRSWSALDGMKLPEGIHLSSAWSGRPGIPGRLEDANKVLGNLRGSLHL